MRKPTGFYPSLTVDTTAKRVVSHAGAVVLVAAVHAVGLDQALSEALSRWRRPLAVRDPGKIVVDLALSLIIGGDCLADIAQLRAEPAVFGRVASDPTVSRLVDMLAADAVAAPEAINTARAKVRAGVWRLAGEAAPDYLISAVDPLVVDLDATLITARSEKEMPAATFTRGFRFHPLGAWCDHGPAGTGVSMLLRKGNAGSNTVADHIAVSRDALRQVPFHRRGGRVGRKVLIRTDGGGGTHEFLQWLTGQGLSWHR